jgi:hypothetical protein
MLEDARTLAPSAVTIPPPELHEALILDSATELGKAVRCTVASLDPLLATDPMPWQPYVTAAGAFYPKKGDRALLSYQVDGTPLIVWWEPSAGSPDKAIPAAGSVEEAQLGAALKKLAVTEPLRSTVETLKILRGRVEVTEAEAKILQGSGFSVTRNAKGTSTVTFSAEFSTPPSVTATATGLLLPTMSAAPGKASFKVVTVIPNTLAAENGVYDFMAIGPR